jgi:excinuclease UvrABC ATPase subunit
MRRAKIVASEKLARAPPASWQRGHQHPRGAHAQPQEHRPRHPAQPAGGDHRPVGSGKSSLAFDTLYAEGQRRYVESLSTYARQFLQLMDKPDVDVIEGLSPGHLIEQKATSHNPRSTVGTVTEIHDYLRLLFARAGTPYCPDHHLPLQAQTVSQMVDAVLALPKTPS